MRILLVQPDCVTARQSAVPGYDETVVLEPLGLEYLAAYLLDCGHEVEILDMRIDRRLGKSVNRFRPGVVGISCNHLPDVSKVKRMAREIKERDSRIRVVVGGQTATVLVEDFLSVPEVDFVVKGEGELTFKELISTLAIGGDVSWVQGIAYQSRRGAVHTAPRELISMDDLKPPARQLVDKYRRHYFAFAWRPHAAVESARGCPFTCNYCAIWKFHERKYRLKSPETVVDEIERLPMTYIEFVDDNFLEAVGRAERIYELIKKRGIKKKYYFFARSDTIVKHPDLIRKWREIGLIQVFVGFEAIDSRVLEQMNKRNIAENNDKAIKILADNNVTVVGMFIVLPEFDQKDFNAVLSYVRKVDRENKYLLLPGYPILTPLPGTDLYPSLAHKVITTDYDLFNFMNIVLPTKLPKDEFERQYVRLWSRTYDIRKLVRMAFNRDFVPNQYSLIQLGVSAWHRIPFFLWCFKRHWAYAMTLLALGVGTLALIAATL